MFRQLTHPKSLTNFIVLIATIALPLATQAKVFHNAYVSFELPDRWDCQIETTEWVCRSQVSPQDSREAIIILTAKEAGPSDNLQAYEQHLKQSKVIASRSGRPAQSQILKVQVTNINGQAWVDGMHLGSEVPNYYTRYMATVRDRIGILVTFSAHKQFYAKYANDFFRAIQSLRVTTSKGLTGNGGGGAVLPGGGTYGGAIPLPGDDQVLPDEGSGGSSSKAGDVLLGLAILLAAIGVYVFIKRNQKK
jgi:hypothetical protein